MKDEIKKQIESEADYDIIRQKIRNEARLRNINDISQFLDGAEYGYSLAEKQSVNRELYDALFMLLDQVKDWYKNSEDVRISYWAKKAEKAIESASQQQEKESDVDLLVRFIDFIRDYERESENLIGHDERESIEFVEIFLQSKTK